MAKPSIIGNFGTVKYLVGKPYCSLELVKQTMHVPLPAEYLSNVKNAVMTVLQDELEIYSPELHGVPVAFNQRTVKLAENYGSVISAQPFIHCDVSCEFVVFNPKVNDLLYGVVNKSTGSSIGCLIHHCFYATIHCNEGKKNKREDDIKIGDTVIIRVTKLQEDGNGVLSIIASFCDVTEGIVPDSYKPEDEMTIQGVDSGIENIDNDAENDISQYDNTMNSQRYSASDGKLSDTGLQSDSLLSSFTKKVKSSKSKKFVDPNAIFLKKKGHTSAIDSSSYDAKNRKQKQSEGVTNEGSLEEKKNLKKEHKKSKKNDESHEKGDEEDVMNGSVIETPERKKHTKKKKYIHKKKEKKNKSKEIASTAESSGLSVDREGVKGDRTKKHRKKNEKKYGKLKTLGDLNNTILDMLNTQERDRFTQSESIHPVHTVKSPHTSAAVQCEQTQNIDVQIESVFSLANKTNFDESNELLHETQTNTSVVDKTNTASLLGLGTSNFEKTKKEKKMKKSKKGKIKSPNNLHSVFISDMQTGTPVHGVQVTTSDIKVDAPSHSFIKSEKFSTDDENMKGNLMSWLNNTIQDTQTSVKREPEEDNLVTARLISAGIKDTISNGKSEERKLKEKRRKEKKEKLFGSKRSMEFKSKRKRKAEISVSIQPPVKRVKQDCFNELPSSSREKSQPDLSSSMQNFDQLEEHHKQALFHLRKLGINLPLSALLSVKAESTSFANQSSTLENNNKEQYSPLPLKHWSPGIISTPVPGMSHSVACVQEAVSRPILNTVSPDESKSKGQKKNKKQKKKKKKNKRHK